MRSAPLIRLAAVAAVAALALTSCSAGAPEPDASSGGGAATAPLLTIGSLTEPTSWDPAQANEGHFAPIYQSVYDTLLKREPDGTLSPMLATEWTMSDDSMSLSLELRTDVTFTDGAVFDGEAVKANIEHFKTANGPQQGNLAAIEVVEVVDADTVNIQLSSPDPDLPNNLANSGGYMASPAALATPRSPQPRSVPAPMSWTRAVLWSDRPSCSHATRTTGARSFRSTRSSSRSSPMRRRA